MTNVSGEQWAAWVQAFGSIGAIVGSFWIARRLQRDEMQRLDLQNNAQAALARRVHEDEVRESAAKEARLNIQRIALALGAMSYMLTILDAIVNDHGDLQLDEREAAPIESFLAVPIETLKQVPLMELPDENTALKLQGILLALRFALDRGKAGTSVTVRVNFGDLPGQIRKVMGVCEQTQQVLRAGLAA